MDAAIGYSSFPSWAPAFAGVVALKDREFLNTAE